MWDQTAIYAHLSESRLKQAVAKLDEPGPRPAADGHYALPIGELANHKQSLDLSSGGGGNRTAGSSSDLDDSRTVSRTGIEENTSKEHEENALPDILMTMSQIPVPDVTGELAEVRAMFEVVDALRRKRGR